MKEFKILITLLVVSYNCLSQQKITTTELEDIIKNPQSQLLDVRTPEEYNNGHLPNSSNMDWKNQSAFMAKIETLNKSLPVYVYCLSGGRSKMASKLLAEKGFTVYNYSGGMIEWRSEEKPEIKPIDQKENNGLTMGQFTQEIKSDRLVLVNYSAQWCVPCQELKPIIDKLEKEHSDKVKILRVDSDQNKTLLKTLNVSAIPKLTIYKNSKEVWTKEGIASEQEILQQLSNFGN